ncbi:hypothetical protein EIP86_001323 [Pleurotus ostreatoroseus]|nr:hypothetical protein EIP86_001323 [Pleurotus ostreatoroseus]
MPAVAHTTGARRSAQPQPTRKLSHEVIVLSSDDESPPPKKMKRTAKERPPRTKRKSHSTNHTPPPVPALDENVIELADSADEFFAPPLAPKPKPKKPSSTSTSQLEARTKALEEENRKLREELQRLNAAVARKLTKASTPDVERERAAKDAVILSKQRLLGELEEHITCDVCALKMWSPYTLSCGHTFCVDCLQQWFNTAVAQHMTAHPDWAPEHPVIVQYRNALRQPNLPPQTRRAIQHQIEQIQAGIPKPEFTCPSCREPVRRAPMEAFALKNIVKSVADAQGEASPGLHGTGGLRRDQLWSGFFPAHEA